MFAQDRSQLIGRAVVTLVSDSKVASLLAEATSKALVILESDQSKLAGTVPLQLDIFGDALPKELRACRLAVMRAGSAYHVERHPNATQYVYSLRESGSISILEDNNWKTTELTSKASDPLSARWHIVPANTWHQPVPGSKNWTVLGFHSVPSTELIDDYRFEGPKRAT